MTKKKDEKDEKRTISNENHEEHEISIDELDKISGGANETMINGQITDAIT